MERCVLIPSVCIWYFRSLYFFTHFDCITHANVFQNSPSSRGSLQHNHDGESACCGGRM